MNAMELIGWFDVERTADRRQVSSKSIPLYLSAVRGMQLILYGTLLLRFSFLCVLRGYRH